MIPFDVYRVSLESPLQITCAKQRLNYYWAKKCIVRRMYVGATLNEIYPSESGTGRQTAAIAKLASSTRTRSQMQFVICHRRQRPIRQVSIQKNAGPANAMLPHRRDPLSAAERNEGN